MFMVMRELSLPSSSLSLARRVKGSSPKAGRMDRNKDAEIKLHIVTVDLGRVCIRFFL